MLASWCLRNMPKGCSVGHTTVSSVSVDGTGTKLKSCLIRWCLSLVVITLMHVPVLIIPVNLVFNSCWTCHDWQLRLTWDCSSLCMGGTLIPRLHPGWFSFIKQEWRPVVHISSLWCSLTRLLGGLGTLLSIHVYVCETVWEVTVTYRLFIWPLVLLNSAENLKWCRNRSHWFEWTFCLFHSFLQT